jgi:hypothetical protein
MIDMNPKNASGKDTLIVVLLNSEILAAPAIIISPGKN